MAKMTKDEVNYRRATGSRHCGNCSMFRPQLREDGAPSSCTHVQGVISSHDTCDDWAPEAA